MIHAEWILEYPGEAFRFGTPTTPVFNRTAPVIGDVEIRAADGDRPRADGRAFGVDHRGALGVTFNLGILGETEALARAEAARLAEAWRADVVRKAPGAVAALSVSYRGRERVVYGRPRRYAQDNSRAMSGLITAVADFAAVDDGFYSPSVQAYEFGILPPLGGGLVAPLVSPLTTTRSSDRSMAITVDTDLPVWPVITITGPITNPRVVIGVDLLDIELRGSVEWDETVVIDTRPWARSVIRNGTASVAGWLRGTRLSRAALPAGSYGAVLRGTDATGTARVRIEYQAAYSAL